MRSEQPISTEVEVLTITLDHEWLDNVMSDQLEVGMPDPVADGGLGAGEEIVDDGDLVTQEH